MSFQKQDSLTLEQAVRRANLLAAAAQVSQNISQIMDIDDLLPKTVDIICDAYDFYYAGVFLVDDEGEFAVLRSGRGEPGRIMMENNHKLAVGGNSMIGASVANREARISLDVDTEKVWYPNPVLPRTRSEMALPLIIGPRVIGAVTVQSVEEAAFSDEDVASLQAMANQLAIAIENARQRRELEQAHTELVRTKTFEAIATATGDAIHWIGNKAEPIRNSVKRITDDVQTWVCAVSSVLEDAPDDIKSHPTIQLMFNEAQTVQERDPDIVGMVERINKLSAKKLAKHLSVSSMLEDLKIIDEAAILIHKIKEELIGPAREQAPRPTMVNDVLGDAIYGLERPSHASVTFTPGSYLPLVIADPLQLHRVFVNLLKNAYEATDEEEAPQIKVSTRMNDTSEFILVDIEDNGVGIATERLDKLWISFHTTKGLKGHMGLGLSASQLIVEQLGGTISVESETGQGAKFTISLPVHRRKAKEFQGKKGEGHIVLIDDGDEWAQFLATTLRGNGYSVSISNAQYQVENLSDTDLILVDDTLANATSDSVYAQLKEANRLAQTIAMSSGLRVERTKDLKLLGVNDVVSKPYTPASLLDEIVKQLAGKN